MAEKQQSQQNYTFLEIYDGRLVERSREPKPNFVETIVYEKDKKTARGVIYLRPVSGLENYRLKAINFEDKTLSDGVTRLRSFKVDLQDADDSNSIYRIQFRFPDVVTSSFMKRLPNIRFGETIEISVFPDKETKRAVLSVKDGQGEKIPFYFSKENPNGMPDAVFFKEENEWDFKAQNSFLKKNTIAIAEELKAFWKENEEMFVTAPKQAPVKPTSAPKHKVVDDDEPLDVTAEALAKPYRPNIQTPQEQLATNTGGDDDLPF